MEKSPSNSIEYRPGRLDDLIRLAEHALAESYLAPAKIDLLKQRLPEALDQGIENNEEISDEKMSLIAKLVDQLNAIDVATLRYNLSNPKH
jgi:hypothetical protein